MTPKAAHEAFLDSVVENIPDMVFVKDAKHLRFVRFNRAGEELLGYDRKQMIGKSDYDFFPEEQADFFTRKDREVLASGMLVDIPEEPIHTRVKGLRILHTKKIPILDARGRPQYLLGISRDITERKQADTALLAAKEALRIQATRDGLTGLWNRGAILGILEREVGRTRREGGRLALVMADLDHFKRINDQYGHPTGDTVLEEVTRRMRSALRAYDAVGRYGGEEFLVVLPGLGVAEAVADAERLRSRIGGRPLEVAGLSLPVTCSFGVTVAATPSELDVALLIRAADAALYRAKDNGRDRVELAAS